MTRTTFLLILALAAPLAADDGPWTGRSENVVEAVFRGRVIATAFVAGGDRTEVAVLVATSGGRQLFRLTPNATLPAPTELPADADSLAVFPIGGADELVVGAPGRIYRLRDGKAELYLEVDDLDLGVLSEAFVDTKPFRLHVPRIGSVDTFVDGDGKLAAGGSIQTPVRARREATGFVLSSLPTARAQLRPDGNAALVVGPEAHGPQRLRTLYYQDGEAFEAWSALPGPENVEDATYRLVNGKPALVAVTSDATFSVFDKKRVHVFALQGRPLDDESRGLAGTRPSFSADTISHRWQRADPVFTDVDGDGKDDLVVVQVEGMGGKKLLLEAFTSLGGTRFQGTPRRTKVDVRDAVWQYGRDFDGDGMADLLVRSGRTVELYGGVRDRKKILGKEPRWSVRLEADVLEKAFAEKTAARPTDAPADEVEAPRVSPRGRALLAETGSRPEAVWHGHRDGWSVVWWVRLP